MVLNTLDIFRVYNVLYLHMFMLFLYLHLILFIFKNN
jgi:hypothetical protein